MEQLRIPAGTFAFDALAAGPVHGDPVLALHGFPESKHEWCSLLDELGANGYRAVAPDQRGYSPDARPPDVADYQIRHLVDDVLGMADTLGAATFHLVGHDWGGLVAWHVAGRHPERVRTLSIVSTPHPRPFAAARASDPDQQQRSTYIPFLQTPDAPEQAFLADDAAQLRALLADLGDDAVQAHVEVLTRPGAMTAALNYYRAWDDELDGLGPVAVPTLYIWSTNDVAIGRVAAEATAEWVSGPYRFEVLEGRSHWLPEVAPDAIDAMVLEQLRSAPRG
jgi:pimeloyl-ACP methyl ester carboxylesterase